MTTPQVQQLGHEPQPTKRIVKTKDQNGNEIISVYSDTNKNKPGLELYSVGKGDVLYIDTDGDGYFDKRYITDLNNPTEEDFTEKSEATKMENVSKKLHGTDLIRPDNGYRGISKKDLKEIEKFPYVTQKGNYLLSKSPLGKKRPTDEQLAHMGYPKGKYMTSNGDGSYGENIQYTHYSSLGYGPGIPKGAYCKFTYIVDGYKQEMFYDKDGNLLKGSFFLGNTDKKLSDFVIAADGKGGFYYIQ